MVENTTTKNSSVKKRNTSALLLTLVFLVLINLVGSYFFFRLDLTTEKRYSLNPATLQLLENLDDRVHIKVYLEGDFNPAFTRLRNETRELLDEFRAYSEKDFSYEFINIYDEENKKELESIQRQLYTKGIVPTELNIKSDKGNTNMIIFPGAIVHYKGKETVWQIFKQQVGVHPDVCINNSVQGLEYELSNCIRILGMKEKPRVAFIQGHGELDTLETSDMHMALREYYDVDYLEINHRLKALNGYKAIIVAQPDSAFDEKDKFIIDQFVMKGGKILWCLDQVYTNDDSLSMRGYTLGLSSDKNLDDLLFGYGVRINNNLVTDLQCTQIPINKGFKKGQPDFQMYPWFYNPLVLPSSNHPITKNLDLIRFEFCNSIDTISTVGLKKTILLSSSKYSRVQTTPARVSLAMASMKPSEKIFNQSNLTLSVLVEGNFKSIYKNRLATQIAKDSAIGFVSEGKKSAMIMVSDGDIIRNRFNKNNLSFYQMGYDRYMRQTFANKVFLLNCMNYLCDGEDLLSIRSREVKLRLLDKKRVKASKVKWQLINTLLPISLIIVSGFVLSSWKRRKYSSSSDKNK